MSDVPEWADENMPEWFYPLLDDIYPFANGRRRGLDFLAAALNTCWDRETGTVIWSKLNELAFWARSKND